MKTSIIIPSLRPEQLEDCLYLLDLHTTLENYEIIVVSPFEVFHPKVRWVKDYNFDGVVRATNRGYEVSTGEYITFLSDECRVFPRWLTNMREFIMTQSPRVVGSFEVVPWFDYTYYGKLFAPFAYIHHDIVRDLGCLFDPRYNSFYADPDLSLRLYEKNYRIETAFGAIIQSPYFEDDVHMNNENAHRLKDRETFINRWSHLGKFEEPQD